MFFLIYARSVTTHLFSLTKVGHIWEVTPSLYKKKVILKKYCECVEGKNKIIWSFARNNQNNSQDMSKVLVR